MFDYLEQKVSTSVAVLFAFMMALLIGVYFYVEYTNLYREIDNLPKLTVLEENDGEAFLKEGNYYLSVVCESEIDGGCYVKIIEKSEDESVISMENIAYTSNEVVEECVSIKYGGEKKVDVKELDWIKECLDKGVLAPEFVSYRSNAIKDKKISVKGVAGEGLAACTLMACVPEDPCCNSCSGPIILEGSRSFIELAQSPEKSTMFGCFGDECSLQCEPLEKGNIYIVNGVWDGEKLIVENYQEDPPTLKSCFKNSDCIRVKKDCCGCSGGGSDTAINKNFESIWEKKMDLECKNYDICSVDMDSGMNCSSESRCIKGECIL